MKRVNNLYDNIISIENLMLADKVARRGKAQQKGVILHDTNREANIALLHDQLINKTYTTGRYKHFMVLDPKPRQISALAYPHRIVHHAIMNYLEPVFVKCFTADTYSCIKGRGIHACHNKIKKALKDVAGTAFYLQMDVTKFYPSIDHAILKAQLRRKIKDTDLLWLLDDIIDSAPGVPIGNYLSQYFANFYLNGLDHFIKETLGIKHYFRYADDMLILGESKAALHAIRAKIQAYLHLELKLTVKGNYKVKPVDDHGINMLGFVYRHTHVMMRKTIKQSLCRAITKNKNRASIASLKGWAKHANTKNLLNKLSHDNHNQIIPRPRGEIKEPYG